MRTPLALVLALAGCNPGGMTSGSEGSGASSGANSDASSGAATGAATGSTTATSSEPTTGNATNGGTTTAGTETSTGGPPPGDLPVGHCGARTGRYFGPDTWIYEDVSSAPVRPDSAATTAWLEANGGWGLGRLQIDTSFVINDADASTPRYTRTPDDPVPYSTDCDPGVQFPVPDGSRIEGLADTVCPGRVDGDYQGDCHLLVADLEGGFLYESFRATLAGGKFYTECDVAWDLSLDVWSPTPAPGVELPPIEDRQWGIGRDCTGPDAAGFPIAPLLFTVGDVMSGKVEHAIRFILPNDRMQRSPVPGGEGPVYVWPATHAGGPQAEDAAAPIYGSRWRLRADFDPASRGLDPENPVVKAVVYGLKRHGMLLADGGNVALTAENADDCGTNWDALWGDKGSRVLEGIQPSDFEIIDVGGTEHGYDCVRNPAR